MSDSLRKMAGRCEADPFFLAYHLAHYRRWMRLEEEALARLLGVTPDALMRLALCRAPEPAKAREDLARVASHFGADLALLAQIVLATGN